MTDETTGAAQVEPYTIDEKRAMLVEGAVTKEAADAIAELTDEQVETAFEVTPVQVAAEDDEGPLPQPPEASVPSTGAVQPQDEPAPAAPDAPKPTVGRIVLWTQEIGSRRKNALVSIPAIVTGTVDHPEGAFGLALDSTHHVHLTVFEPGAEPYTATNVRWDATGLEHGTWRWPERV